MAAQLGVERGERQTTTDDQVKANRVIARQPMHAALGSKWAKGAGRGLVVLLDIKLSQIGNEGARLVRAASAAKSGGSVTYAESSLDMFLGLR